MLKKVTLVENAEVESTLVFTTNSERIEYGQQLVLKMEFAKAIETVKPLLVTEGLSEDEIMSVLNILVASNIGLYKISKSALEGHEILRDLYVLIMSYGNDQKYSPYFRASILTNINFIFKESSFNTYTFLTSLEVYDQGKIFKYYNSRSDLTSPEAKAYTAIFDFNRNAESLYPDKINIGWQAWVVAVSFSESEPPPELFYQFRDYLVKQFRLFDDSKYTISNSDQQQAWLDSAIKDVKIRLSKKYPSDFIFE